MIERYDFRVGAGFPNLLSPVNDLSTQQLNELSLIVETEYQRLQGLAEVGLGSFVPFTGLPKELNLKKLLHTPLVEVKGIPNVASDAVYDKAGFPFSEGKVLVRVEVLRRLKLAGSRLPEGLGLIVLDGWRNFTFQQRLYEMHYAGNSALAEGFVSRPDPNPETPPPHTTGGTVDATLTFRGIPLALGTRYDEFNELSYANAKEGLRDIEWKLRQILYYAMYEGDFVVIPQEWWHFEYGTRFHAAAAGKVAQFGRCDVNGKAPVSFDSEADTQVLDLP